VIGWFALLGCIESSEPASTLDAPEFRFCHDPVVLTRDRDAWCRFVEELPEDRCPAVREACARPEGASEEPESGCTERDPERPDGQDPYVAERPVLYRWSSDATRELLQWTGAFLVAALVLVLLRAIWVTAGRLRGAPPPGAEAEGPAPVATAAEADEALPDVPALGSGALIERAETAFAEGRWGEAAWLARGAALKHLHGVERVRLHRSKTDREYLRSVRDEPAVEADLGVVVAAAEAHRWGAVAVAHEVAREALAATRRLLGLGALALLLLFGATRTAGAQDRYGPHGDAGLARVLTLHGFDAGYRLVSLESLDETTDVLILDLSELTPSEPQWAALRGWVDQGGILVVAGEVETGFPEVGERVEVRSDVLLRRGPLVGVDTPLPRWPGGPGWAFTGGAPWVEVDNEAGARVVVGHVDLGAGVVVAISDPRLLDNLALVDAANAAFVGDLLHLGPAHLGWPLPTPARVRLATRASLTRNLPQNNPVASVANARLLPFVLQLLATWTLLSLWRGWPFARATGATEASGGARLSFGEHVTALGTRWYRLGASGLALREVAALWYHRLGTAGLHLAARRAGYSEGDAQAFVERVLAAAQAEDPEPSDGDQELMEEIWTITRQPT